MRALATTASITVSVDAFASFGFSAVFTEPTDFFVRHSFENGRRTVLKPMPEI